MLNERIRHIKSMYFIVPLIREPRKDKFIETEQSSGFQGLELGWRMESDC
jgi:hypothetical protein